MDTSEIDALLQECDALPDRHERAGDNEPVGEEDVVGEMIAPESIFPGKSAGRADRPTEEPNR